MELKMDEAVDIVHPVGRKMDNKNRHVTAVLCSQSQVKEEIWQQGKDSAVCKDKGIHFDEMLPWADWEERSLWPQIEQARRAGKPAFLVRMDASKDVKLEMAGEVM